MRPQDKPVFLAAARHFQLWILIRRTNIESLRYIGRPNFVPKPLDCKVKTADSNVGGLEIAGLVIDPTVHPHAFDKPAKKARACDIWRKFGPAMVQSGRYSVEFDSASPHYGCLKLSGKYIHGDYDLYDIIDPVQPYRNLALVRMRLGQVDRRGANFHKVQRFVADGIGCEMIQHGGEAQYPGDQHEKEQGQHLQESIDAFGPNGEDVTILNEYSINQWYDERFMGRKTHK